MFTYGQKIGEIAPEKPLVEFPENAWGADLLFSDGGFGLGTFYRKNYSTKIDGFINFSISESKNEREFEYFDYYGRSIVIGKKNRVFLLPINVGVNYRLFENELTDNLRPYISIGVGPTIIISTPYKEEFFSSFKHANSFFAAGGYIGFGADFGLSTTNLLGLSMRYYYMKFLSGEVEHMDGRFKNEIGAFYLTLNIGIMY
ncbi:MAG: hypothetical protein KKF62_17845 [Bacteroidetes bacterium]|nr:hypothetical protein [Bacteroidota bacterium]MBU1116658.1 hypothetical protein [Bacteroidota bacterium]MBU1797491.1 hypothetical protein [Bacteroidota bacterium]